MIDLAELLHTVRNLTALYGDDTPVQIMDGKEMEMRPLEVIDTMDTPDGKIVRLMDKEAFRKTVVLFEEERKDDG